MENKTKFYRIILECPLGSPLSDCAFNSYRQMPVTRLIEESNKLNPTELKNMLLLHDECVSKRKNNKLAG